MSDVLSRAVLYGRMIKIAHSVFALPFALASAALAAREGFRWPQVLWIVVAMVGARSAAMGFNRLADHAIDARNPRTASRELPAGVLGRGEVWALVLLSAAALVFAAAMLNPLCLALSPVALAIVFGYSYTKRFTALSHLVLGLALAIAPVGAWLAIRGAFSPIPALIGLAVLFWVGGFDVIYACQDVDFDRASGLHSVPARLGIPRALTLARGFHVIAVALLAAVYAPAGVHALYLAGVAAIAAILFYEHTLVRADDLSRVDAAFFTMNGWVSVLYLAVTLAAIAAA
jgi:4-hydroxybenzoate polyprenyltransferase